MQVWQNVTKVLNSVRASTIQNILAVLQTFPECDTQSVEQTLETV